MKQIQKKIEIMINKKVSGDVVNVIAFPHFKNDGRASTPSQCLQTQSSRAKMRVVTQNEILPLV